MAQLLFSMPIDSIYSINIYYVRVKKNTSNKKREKKKQCENKQYKPLYIFYWVKFIFLLSRYCLYLFP